MGKRSWAGLAVLALLAALWSSCGGEETTPAGSLTPGVPATGSSPGAAQVAEGTAEMLVDAVSGGEITATVEVSGSTPFQVDISIRGATTGYQGYQYYLEWDPKVLAADSHVDLKPVGLDMCAAANITVDRLAAGCVNAAGTTTFAGPVGTITFHCANTGTSALHLVTSADRPATFTTAMAPRGLIIPTSLTDASVTCLGG